MSLSALYAFFNKGINSDDVLSAIQDTDDMNDVVESEGEGGPEAICSEFIGRSNRPGGASCDNIFKIGKRKRKK